MQPDRQIVSVPPMRRLAQDIGWLTRSRYSMRGLVEVDVTRPRVLIREKLENTGGNISFTAFLTACVAKAVDADKSVQALLDWRGRLVIFDEVDISVLIEREMGGIKYPLAHIVRGANKKSLRDIHTEIRTVQVQPGSDKEANTLRTVIRLPRFIRRLMLWSVTRSTVMRKQNLGTVTLSAVGMFGNTSGWAMAPNFHPLGLIVGSIVRKPGVVDDRIEVREYLSLTLDFDHSVIDGAPAARFTRRLTELIECGDEIDQTSVPENSS
jgi:pyruvate/2-oxoglutarate dehydrogenase complex dihydrolipoamide acyltransferase (E2) component